MYLEKVLYFVFTFYISYKVFFKKVLVAGKEQKIVSFSYDF